MHSGIWSGVQEQLSQQFRLHLIDLPGHGLSPASEPGTLNHLVEIITKILPEHCIVGGWSLGGQIAMELALREPKREATDFDFDYALFCQTRRLEVGHGTQIVAAVFGKFETQLCNHD